MILLNIAIASYVSYVFISKLATVYVCMTLSLAWNYLKKNLLAPEATYVKFGGQMLRKQVELKWVSSS